MKLKRLLALTLTGCLAFSLAACGGKKDSAPAASETPAAEATETKEAQVQDWKHYDDLINEIRVMTDFAEREKKMHEAEDMLMDTGAIIPLYYYNDVYMMKPEVKGVYATPYGYKYFQFADLGGKDTMRIMQASEPARLDPALNSSVDGAILAISSFAGLYTYDENNEPVPDLVESVEVSEDGKTYTFTLKEGLKWSDGSDLTAKDFEYSWKRAAATETAADYSYMFDVIKGAPDELAVTASEDGKTFTVELNAPCAYFYDLCAFPTFFPVKQDQVEAAEGYKGEDGKIKDAGAWAVEAGFVSNGPFTLESWNHNESMTYVKNPNYHRADDVKLEKLEFMLSSDNTAALAAYEAGDLDFIDGIPTEEMQSLKERDDFYKIDQLGTYYACFNVNSPLFEGKTPAQAAAMRKGIGALIDREYIINTVAQAEQVPADSFLPPNMANGHGGVFKSNSDIYTYPEGTGYYDATTVDIDKAIEYLKEAGFEFDGDQLSPNTPLHIEYLTNQMDSHEAIAAAIQQDLAEVGIEMKIKTQDWEVFLETRKKGDYDMARNGWISDFNDPINMLEMWTSDSGNNDCQLGR